MRHKIETNLKKNSDLTGLPDKSLFLSVIPSPFVQKVIETFATRLFLMGMSLITTVMVARILGPDGQGLYALATTTTAIGVQLGTLGVHASNTYFVAKDHKLLPTQIGNSLVISFGFGTLAVGLAWGLFFLLPNFAPIQGLILVLALAWIPFGLAYILLKHLLLGIYKISDYNKLELSTKSITTLFVGIVFITKFATVETVFLAGLVGVIIGCFWVFLRLKPYLSSPPWPSAKLFRDNLRYGIKAYLASLFALMVLKADLLMINYYCSAEETGLYSIAVALCHIIYMLPTVVGNLIFPKLCAISSYNQKWTLIKKVSLNLSFVMIIIMLLLSTIANSFITFIFGKAYAASAELIVWLLPGIWIWSIESIYRKLLTSDGFRTEVIYAWFTALAVNIALNLFLIPRSGIKGAALASSISFFIVAFFTLIFIKNTLKNQHE